MQFLHQLPLQAQKAALPLLDPSAADLLQVGVGGDHRSEVIDLCDRLGLLLRGEHGVVLKLFDGFRELGDPRVAHGLHGVVDLFGLGWVLGLPLGGEARRTSLLAGVGEDPLPPPGLDLGVAPAVDVDRAADAVLADGSQQVDAAGPLDRARVEAPRLEALAVVLSNGRHGLLKLVGHLGLDDLRIVGTCAGRLLVGLFHPGVEDNLGVFPVRVLLALRLRRIDQPPKLLLVRVEVRLGLRLERLVVLGGAEEALAVFDVLNRVVDPGLGLGVVGEVCLGPGLVLHPAVEAAQQIEFLLGVLGFGVLGLGLGAGCCCSLVVNSHCPRRDRRDEEPGCEVRAVDGASVGDEMADVPIDAQRAWNSR